MLSKKKKLPLLKKRKIANISVIQDVFAE